MKRRVFIGLLLLIALAACHSPEVPPSYLGSPLLQSIDSLVWQQPDSALTCLVSYFGACNDTLHNDSTAYNRHYAQLLLAEALYKNDYTQANRDALQQAVAYFDALAGTRGADTGDADTRDADTRDADTRDADTRGVSLQAEPRRDARRASANDATAFLAARAHYINGVGYYEQDSAVLACQEYLKTLEIMEEHFEKKKLVGQKAKFMALTYNRIGELFSAQFMSDLSIICYEHSLAFCEIEPTSLFGVSNTLLCLGKQYDKIGEKHKARQYYEEAIAALPDTNNLVYRNITAIKALCDYQCGAGFGYSLTALRQVLALANSEVERLTRFLTIGGIFFEEKMYDSAIFYLEPVFECDDRLAPRIQAAYCLHIINNNRDDKNKTNEYAQFLAHHRKPEGQNKVLVSQLERLFQDHRNQEREKEAAMEKQEAVEKTLKTVVLIAVAAGIALFFTLKRRHNKHMRVQQAEARQMLEEKERELTSKESLLKRNEAMAEQRLETERKRHAKAMEAERQSHKMQQAALSGRLKRSNKELRNVLKQLEHTSAKTALDESVIRDDYTAYLNTPVCLDIVKLVHAQQFKSKMDYLVYKENALSKEQILALRHAAEKHLTQFKSQIRKQFPNLTDSDMDYCYLFLLGLNEADISALMQRAYTTVCDRSRKISRIIGANDSIYQALCNMLREL